MSIKRKADCAYIMRNSEYVAVAYDCEYILSGANHKGETPYSVVLAPVKYKGFNPVCVRVPEGARVTVTVKPFTIAHENGKRISTGIKAHFINIVGGVSNDCNH